MQFYKGNDHVANSTINMDIFSGFSGPDADTFVLDVDDIKTLYFLTPDQLKEWIECLAKRIPKE
ncbi:MAG: hypothetical protein KUG67_02845 [Proteobacteria bacterium]|nr:hypothetical protein [Pseudomonadota bacterium]